ncbi:MAG: M20/M25/M40 family metallo-hydrolase [Pirellulaceae bacterium]|nr:M20/M25/M40 family metallo-hydrolase [Pirellulaceae bacterium]
MNGTNLTRLWPLANFRKATFRKLWLAVALAVWAGNVGLDRASAADKAETTAAAAASESRLRDTVTYLASDELEGRGVGTAGLDKAAEHLAEEFTNLGLKTDLFDGTPFQKFTLNLAAEMGPAEQNRLTLVGPKGETVLKLGTDFNPLAAGGSGAFEAPLVFAGYGIAADDLKQNGEAFKYDDYAGLDVKGKVVVVIRKEPQQKDAKSPFNGLQNTEHATFVRKIAVAADRGAAGLIIVNDGVEVATKRADDVKLLGDVLGKLAGLKESLAQAPADKQAAEASEIRKFAEQAAEIATRLAGAADQPLPFDQAGGESRTKLPVLFATRSAIDAVLKAAGLADLATVEQQIDEDLKPRSAEIPGFKAIGEANLVRKEVEVKNVIAVLEGEGPLADETIVVGAHYDHLGQGGMGSLAPWTSAIHNGADDNASGTATLVEVAHRLATSGQKPKRRIVFMAFTGEERGLLGSAHYVRNPRFALEKTIAMFNLDMVGRLKDEKLAVYGTGTAQEFEPLVDALAGKYGFTVSKHPGGFGPSDHSSFYGKKIPVLHLFTGTHPDYHRPSDDSDKLNIEGMRRITDMLVDVIQATDASEARPSYIDIKKVEGIQVADASAADRPYFGSMPAYPNPEKDGVLLEMVADGSPAAAAGIKGGDVLLQIGEKRVVTLEDFQAVLSGFKPGDKVKTKVRRGTETVEGETTLSRRPRP